MKFNSLGITSILVLVSFLALISTITAGYFFYKSQNTNNLTPTQTQSPKPQAYQLKGVLVLKENVVEIKKTDGSWEALEKGSTIEQKDVIRTGQNSKAVVNLDDGSSIRLDQESEVSFSAITDGAISLDQQKGYIFHRVNKGKLVYTVRSLDTVVTALGTSFSVNTIADQQKTEVAVLESKVALTTKNQDSQTEVSSGQMATIDKDKVTLATLSKDSLESLGKDFSEFDKLTQAEVKPSPTEVAQPQKTQTPQISTSSSGSISLVAIPKPSSVALKWSVSGSAPYGYKVIKSKNPNPQFPPREGDFYEYVSSPAQTSFVFNNLKAGITYYFRVGAFNGDKDNKGIFFYSNEVSATPLP